MSAPPRSVTSAAQLQPWWTHYWGSATDMIGWFDADHASALAAATALDQSIHDQASAAAGGGATGEHYAAVCALALRQAVAGTELVDRGGSPWAFLKEISSDGNMSTIDVTYPAFPAYLHLSPAYLRLLLEPLLDYAEHGGWPKEFAEHDVGSSYPNATGHNDGNEEDMPVEESANMLIMAAAVIQRLPAADAQAFASAHYTILRQWAEYLAANALDPGFQNQTDDFTGFIAHSANLALKGIVGIGAMSVVAAANGAAADAAHYATVARSYISQWTTLAEDSSGAHLKLAYDQDGTWSLKYNGFPDRLLGLDLVPLGTTAREAGLVRGERGRLRRRPRPAQQLHQGRLGVVDRRAGSPTTAPPATCWSTGSTDSPTPPRSGCRSATGTWWPAARSRASRTGRWSAGCSRSLLAPAASTVAWHRIQNKNSGKVLAVSGMSLADTAEVTQYADNGTADHVWTLSGQRRRHRTHRQPQQRQGARRPRPEHGRRRARPAVRGQRHPGPPVAHRRQRRRLVQDRQRALGQGARGGRHVAGRQRPGHAVHGQRLGRPPLAAHLRA